MFKFFKKLFGITPKKTEEEDFEPIHLSEEEFKNLIIVDLPEVEVEEVPVVEKPKRKITPKPKVKKSEPLKEGKTKTNVKRGRKPSTVTPPPKLKTKKK